MILTSDFPLFVIFLKALQQAVVISTIKLDSLFAWVLSHEENFIWVRWHKCIEFYFFFFSFFWMITNTSVRAAHYLDGYSIEPPNKREKQYKHHKLKMLVALGTMMSFSLFSYRIRRRICSSLNVSIDHYLSWL